MIGVDSIIAKIEAKLASTLADRLEVATEFCAEKLSITTVTHWDGTEKGREVFDLTEIVTEIKRLTMVEVTELLQGKGK